MPAYHRPPADRRALAPITARAARPARPRAKALPDVSGIGYAVVDLETTGLSPTTDRILEIGLVLAAPDGSVERSWSTLVAPRAGRDGRVEVGPTFIHGIVPEDLAGAPALDDIADFLVRDLAGRAVVAHNARFDVGFLTHALTRLGRLVRGSRVPRVCTMEWSRHFISTPSRGLTTCCEVSGVEIGHHHSALDDALASAGLLRHYMAVGSERGEDPVAWARSLAQARAFGGWTWDESAARAQEGLLLPRSGEGVPREQVPPHS